MHDGGVYVVVCLHVKGVCGNQCVLVCVLLALAVWWLPGCLLGAWACDMFACLLQRGAGTSPASGLSTATKRMQAITCNCHHM